MTIRSRSPFAQILRIVILALATVSGTRNRDCYRTSNRLEFSSVRRKFITMVCVLCRMWFEVPSVRLCTRNDRIRSRGAQNNVLLCFRPCLSYFLSLSGYVYTQTTFKDHCRGKSERHVSKHSLTLCFYVSTKRTYTHVVSMGYFFSFGFSLFFSVVLSRLSFSVFHLRKHTEITKLSACKTPPCVLSKQASS